MPSQRKQPPMLMRSGLTNTVYIVLRYTDHGNGHYTAHEKIDITQHFLNFVGEYLNEFDITPVKEGNTE